MFRLIGRQIADSKLWVDWAVPFTYLTRAYAGIQLLTVILIDAIAQLFHVGAVRKFYHIGAHEPFQASANARQIKTVGATKMKHC